MRLLDPILQARRTWKREVVVWIKLLPSTYPLILVSASCVLTHGGREGEGESGGDREREREGEEGQREGEGGRERGRERERCRVSTPFFSITIPEPIFYLFRFKLPFIFPLMTPFL